MLLDIVVKVLEIKCRRKQPKLESFSGIEKKNSRNKKSNQKVETEMD